MNFVPEKIFQGLKERFPEAKCELNYQTPLDLLIAAILSAQCTDDRVNLVTRSLFIELKKPEDYIKIGQEKLEERIKSLGLYHNKAKNIIALCRVLVNMYNGKVPQNFDALCELPGVGRKTANVVISNAYGIPALAVDTHVFRVSKRIGLATENTPEKVEEQLKTIFPREQWILIHHLLIFQGRRICTARNPKCKECSIKSLCKAFENNTDRQDKLKIK